MTHPMLPSGSMDLIQDFKKAVLNNRAEDLTALLDRHPELKQHLDDPLFAFDQPALVFAAGQGHRPIIDVLLQAGANINARSHWWAGSFGVLDSADPDLAQYLI